jgi:hypothetical protein
MPESQLQTPVAFLIYNRLDTTARVFAQIAQAQPTKLLVVADGPRSDRPGDDEQCVAVRAVIDRVDWDCEVLTNYAVTNLGCKRRVSSGLDWVFDTVEEAIILEDDCLPHPTFFGFCEELLKRYRHDERIMMIAGTNYLLNLDIPESYLFSRYFAIWGWASWRRAWNQYDIHMQDWPVMKSRKQLEAFYNQRFVRQRMTSMFDSAYQNEINTWDIQWFYSCLFNHGLSIVPKVNLISNIGVVGTHSTCTNATNDLPMFSIERDNLIHPHLIFPNQQFDATFFEKYYKLGGWLAAILTLQTKLIAPIRNIASPAPLKHMYLQARERLKFRRKSIK